MAKNYFDVLGLSKDATTKEIKKAYKQLAGKYHPDRLLGLASEKIEESTKKFMEIKEAYDCLIDPKQRRDYINSEFSVTSNPRLTVESFWEKALK